jgi:hypothetical protein
MKKSLILLFFISPLLFFSCKKDKYQNHSKLVNKNAALQDFLPALVSTAEKDTVFEFPFELTDNTIAKTKISVKAISGTATEGEDFEILTPEVVIDQFNKSGVVRVKLLLDDIVEGPESFVLQVGDSLDANVHVFKNITFNITDDYFGPDLDVAFLWNKTVTVSGVGDVPTGLNFDLDFYFVDESGDDHSDYSSATSSYPEVHTFSSTVDTTIYIYANLWDNLFRSLGTGLTDLQPITMDFHRDGSLGSFTKTQADSVAFNLDSPDGANDGDYTLVYMGKIVVSGGTFTFYDTDDTSLFNARRRQVILSRIKATQSHTTLFR